MGNPQLIWQVGTAYDMILSLHVLYEPERYGLRGAWAAGVRSRLPAEEREFFQRNSSFLWPLDFLHELPLPKDGAALLAALAALPERERLPAMAALPQKPGGEMNEMLQRVAAQGSWDDADYASLRAWMVEHRSAPPSKKDVVAMLDMWSRPEVFGALILSGLKAYYEAFFAEEEARIRPALQEAVVRGQALAAEMPLLALLEELSQGLRLEALPEVAEMVMVPSFWISPLIIEYPLRTGQELFVFGARPGDASLVPGEFVPDALYQALKALADPTRLRILHYLTDEPSSPSQLARRLRLRAPTVVHHLHVMRLARLVHLTMGAEGKRRYTVRPGAVEATFAALKLFMEQEDDEGDGSPGDS